MTNIWHIGHKRRIRSRKRRKFTKEQSCYNSKGKLKQQFFSYEEALEAVLDLKRNNKALGWFNIYPCEYCTKEAKMGTPRNVLADQVIEILVGEYDVEKEDATIAVDKATEAGLFRENRGEHSLAETIYDDNKYWTHLAI